MKGSDYLVLVFKKYEMDFRDYLRYHRDPQILSLSLSLSLSLIFKQVVEGVIQLHG
jgi:hypothetical protein